jgi:hypothetical protein
VSVQGWYTLTGNQITGFDEPGCAALMLGPDRLGKPPPNIYRGNRVSRCAVGVAESLPGLWEAAVRAGNVFTDCGGKLPEG